MEVFGKFVELHMKVFPLNMTRILQVKILQRGKQIIRFTIFRDQHLQYFKYAITMYFCSFYIAPHKNIAITHDIVTSR